MRVIILLPETPQNSNTISIKTHLKQLPRQTDIYEENRYNHFMAHSKRTHQKKLESGVFFCSHLPSPQQVILKSHPSAERMIVVCDKKLKAFPALKPWRNPQVSFYFISAGEKEKTVEKLPFHLEKILSLAKGAGKESLLMVSLGGGSIGDLTGFLAAIYQRGVPLVHFPTTWLSALDSAHGGKTALNFKKIKNAVGTYWFPKNVFIVRDFLKHLSEKEKQSALGELLKTALIKGGSFYDKLKNSVPHSPQEWESFLKEGIAVKRNIVQRDPYETKGLRRKLNLGHTLGHILESAYGLPHGQAVSEGILFSAKWSFKKQFLSRKNLLEIKTLIRSNISFEERKPISVLRFKNFLKRDKKRRNTSDMDFIFIHRPGNVVIQSVSEKDILEETKRQGWVI